MKVLLGERLETNVLGEEKTVQDVLSIEPSHYNGKYKVTVNKEEVKNGFRSFLLFADGNFNVTVGSGRKSAKKLEKLEQYINRNKEELVSMWKAKKYQLMVDTICQDVVIEKLV